MPRYEFRSPGLRVRLVDPAIEGGVGVRIEHDSGAALLVRSVIAKKTEAGLHVDVTGFDGTQFAIDVDPEWASVQIRSSSPTPILGGGQEAAALRAKAAESESGPVRVTGDETTMPINVDED